MPFETFSSVQVLQNFPNQKNCSTLLAALIAAFRLGHTCIRKESGGLFPSFGAEMEEMLLKEWEEAESQASEESPIQFLDNQAFLFRSATYEQEIADNTLQKIKQNSPAISLDLNALNEEQKEAVIKGVSHSPFILTGGPGTGKTYTLARLIGTKIKHNPELKIAVAAPTGKAAMRLSDEISKQLGDVVIEAMTLHALLGTAKGNSLAPIHTKELVVIDECSMIDLRFWNLLLKKANKETDLIFAGDPDQLPPVDTGSLFFDLCESFKKHFPKHITGLTKCMRIDQSAILHLAQAVNQHDEKTFFEILNHNEGSVQRVEQIPVDFPWRISKSDPFEILREYERFRILSPLREGTRGIHQINEHFAQISEKSSQVFHPIMIKKNQPELSLYNGDTGVITYPKSQKKEGRAFFLKEDEVVDLPVGALPPYEYAYCVSVHKSQGSEYQEVLLLLPEGSEVFGKEVLYTAITRARKHFSLLASDRVLKAILKKDGRLLSGIQKRIDRLVSLQPKD